MQSPFGYYVMYELGGAEATSSPHRFCGLPTTPGATCPNCDKPLLEFLSLDTRDERLGLANWSCTHLPLLFCWTCNLSQAPFSYRVFVDSITIIQCKEGGVVSDFPYEDYPTHFPEARAVLVPVPEADAKTIAKINRDGVDYHAPDARSQMKLDELRHQIGGEPRLIQGSPPEPFSCPRCEASMHLFATIADDCLDRRGFTDNCGVQVIYFVCEGCHVVGCRQECD